MLCKTGSSSRWETIPHLHFCMETVTGPSERKNFYRLSNSHPKLLALDIAFHQLSMWRSNTVVLKAAGYPCSKKHTYLVPNIFQNLTELYRTTPNYK